MGPGGGGGLEPQQSKKIDQHLPLTRESLQPSPEPGPGGACVLECDLS